MSIAASLSGMSGVWRGCPSLVFCFGERSMVAGVWSGAAVQAAMLVLVFLCLGSEGMTSEAVQIIFFPTCRDFYSHYFLGEGRASWISVSSPGSITYVLTGHYFSPVSTRSYKKIIRKTIISSRSLLMLLITIISHLLIDI